MDSGHRVFAFFYQISCSYIEEASAGTTKIPGEVAGIHPLYIARLELRHFLGAIAFIIILIIILINSCGTVTQ
jgi:hypothetical protein